MQVPTDPVALHEEPFTPIYKTSTHAIGSNQTYLDIPMTFSFWMPSQNLDVPRPCRGLTSMVFFTSLLDPQLSTEIRAE